MSCHITQLKTLYFTEYYKILKLDGSSIKSVRFEPFLIKCKKQISCGDGVEEVSDVDLDISDEETESRNSLADITVAVNDKLENDNDDGDSDDIYIDGITEFVSMRLHDKGSIKHIRSIILFVDQPLTNDYIKSVTAEDPHFS